MERVLTIEERIRRAEEIYNRRKDQSVRVPTYNVNNNSKPNFNLLKKMLIQILICVLLYIIFYLIQNTNYIFSEDVLNKTKEILSYDINFNEMYQQCVNYFKPQQQTNTNEEIQINTIENVQAENVIIENELIGLSEPEVLSAQEESAPLSQMEIDANELKSKYSPINPITGTITSKFRTKRSGK